MAVNESAQCTPVLLAFGQELRTSAKLFPGEEQRDFNHLEHVETLQRKTEKVHPFARENVRISVTKVKRL